MMRLVGIGLLIFGLVLERRRRGARHDWHLSEPVKTCSWSDGTVYKPRRLLLHQLRAGEPPATSSLLRRRDVDDGLRLQGARLSEGVLSAST